MANNKKPVKSNPYNIWLIGLLVTILMGLLIFMGEDVFSRVAVLENRDHEITKNINNKTEDVRKFNETKFREINKSIDDVQTGMNNLTLKLEVFMAHNNKIGGIESKNIAGDGSLPLPL